MERVVQSSNVLSLLSLLSTIVLAASSGTEVNKLTTSKDTCDSYWLIQTGSIIFKNSMEFFTVCTELSTNGDKTFSKI